MSKAFYVCVKWISQPLDLMSGLIEFRFVSGIFVYLFLNYLF